MQIRMDLGADVLQCDLHDETIMVCNVWFTHSTSPLVSNAMA